MPTEASDKISLVPSRSNSYPSCLASWPGFSSRVRCKVQRQVRAKNKWVPRHIYLNNIKIILKLLKFSRKHSWMLPQSSKQILNTGIDTKDDENNAEYSDKYWGTCPGMWRMSGVWDLRNGLPLTRMPQIVPDWPNPRPPSGSLSRWAHQNQSQWLKRFPQSCQSDTNMVGFKHL